MESHTPEPSSREDEPSTPRWVAARLAWSAGNRSTVERMKEAARKREEERQLAQEQLRQAVQARRQHASGRAAAARADLQEKNHQNRLKEGRRQQFALDEKARRLQMLRDYHREVMNAQFVPLSIQDFGSESFRLYNLNGTRTEDYGCPLPSSYSLIDRLPLEPSFCRLHTPNKTPPGKAARRQILSDS